jgi:hypothetical protein
MFEALPDGRIIHKCYEIKNNGKEIFKRQRFEDLEECKSVCLDLIAQHSLYHRSDFNPVILAITEESLFVYDTDNRTMKGV